MFWISSISDVAVADAISTLLDNIIVLIKNHFQLYCLSTLFKWGLGTTIETSHLMDSAGTQTVRDVRATLPESCRTRSTARGFSAFAMSAAAYLVTFVLLLAVNGWLFKLLAALANSFFIAVLFVIGHDACHGGLTPRPWLNRLIGRLAFLPSLHPYTAWEFSHNGMHHGWANLRTKDPGYPPFSKADFDHLPKHRQFMERLYRTPFGIGLFYLIEVWWNHQVFPKGTNAPKKRKTFAFDRICCLCFLGCETAAVIIFPFVLKNFMSTYNTLALFSVEVIVPFFAWNWIAGFLTFQHHTHPKVAWYADENEWSFFRGHVQGTVHVIFPRPIEFILHNIMDHTAHHVDPKIPLYNLPRAQHELELAYGSEIVAQRLTLQSCLCTFSKCKLYDYQNHRWTDFDGNPTTDRLLIVGETRR